MATILGGRHNGVCLLPSLAANDDRGGRYFEPGTEALLGQRIALGRADH